MNKRFTAVTLAGGVFIVVADGSLLWHGESITYLYGEDFKVDPRIQQMVTFEHASAWTWGDLFLFVDSGTTNANDGHHGFYGEVSPRLSFGKLSGRDRSWGPISDVLLATTRGHDQNDGPGAARDQRNYLMDPGFDLRVPGFDYFQLNLYQRAPSGT